MPTYRYRCLDCKKVFELNESMREHGSARHACPKCGRTNVTRVFSAPFVKTSKKS